MTGAAAQSTLRERLRARLAASGIPLEPSLLEGRGVLDETPPESRLEALVIVRRLALDHFSRAAMAFAGDLAPEEKTAWYRQFTRTQFLAGNPGALQTRFALTVVASDGSAAFVAPAPAPLHQPLKRLLRPLRTAGPVGALVESEVRVAFPSPGGRARRLWLGMQDLPVERYLVHLNHLLCEAVLEGHLTARDGLSIVNVQRLEALPAAALVTRVQRDEADPERLRLYGLLEAEEYRV
jgi:hypothetical protein